MTTPTLRPYQKRAVLFALKNPASYLALDMGLGKTYISLTWISDILAKDKSIKSFLVLAPLKTIYATWPDEIQKWKPELTYTILHGDAKDSNLKKDVDLYLMNYEGLHWLFRALMKYKTWPFQALIIDEGSMLKSSSTVRFKTLKHIVPRLSKWRLILSGTPAPGSLLDLWPQYYLLDGGKRLGPTITPFRFKYFTQINSNRFTWKIKASLKPEIYKLIDDITFRLDAEDHIRVPKKENIVVPIELPKDKMTMYKALEEDFYTSLSGKESIEVFNVLSLSMKLRQFVQGAVYNTEDTHLPASQRRVIHIHNKKLDFLEALVTKAAGQGILCAIQFRFELDMIKSRFPNTPVIAGGTSSADSLKYIRAWNAKEIPLLLCHPLSLSHGVNLQTGSHIILWYGLTWSLEQYLQLNARLHRSGQTKPVKVYHLVAKNTIDEKIYSALRGKFRGQQELLNYLRRTTKDK